MIKYLKNTIQHERNLLMGSPIGGKRSVKVFVLYLMENINYPLEFSTIGDIVMQTDYVMYLDFAECFNEMLDGDLIVKSEEDGKELYSVTDKGRVVARELKRSVPPSILDESLAKALSHLNFKKRGIVPMCTVEDAGRGKFNVICTFTEKSECIFKQMLTVDSFERAQQLKANFYDRPEAIYRGVIALLAGKVNYLFD